MLKQIDNPVLLDQADEEIILTFGITGSAGQHLATLEGLTIESARDYLLLVKEVIAEARSKGVPIEVDDEIMEKTQRHEMQHVMKAHELGFDLGKSELNVGFGLHTGTDGQKHMEVSIAFGPGISQDPVKSAIVNLAPDDPSPKDINAFLMWLQNNKEMFLQRPRETMWLLRKYAKATGASPLDVFKLLSKKSSDSFN